MSDPSVTVGVEGTGVGGDPYRPAGVRHYMHADYLHAPAHLPVVGPCPRACTVTVTVHPRDALREGESVGAWTARAAERYPRPEG